MREIKFRAWDKDLKKMFYKGFGVNDNGQAYDYDNEWTDELLEKGFVNAGIHKKKILMQFTGLKDKAGKEIYEGDIVKNIPEPNSYGGWWDGIVTWQPEGNMGWCIEPLPENKHKGRYGMNYNYVFEIIGNIHQPELMEKP